MKWKRPARYIGILLAALILLTLGVGSIINVMANVMRSDVVGQLEDKTALNQERIQQRVKNDFEGLERLAAAVGYLQGPNSDEALKLIMREEWKMQNARITVSDAQGESRSNDGLKKNISGDELFKLAMEGTPSISGVRPALMNKEEENTLVMMVPIESDRTIIGTLAMTRDVAYYRDLLDFALFDTQGSSYIMQQDGTVLIWNEETGTPMEPAQEVESLIKALGGGEAGIQQIKDTENGDFYLAYAPLEMNDWFLVSRISVGAVDEPVSALRRVAVSVGAVAAIVFFILLAVLYITTERRERQIEQAATVDSLTGLFNWQYMQRSFADITNRGEWNYLFLRVQDFSKISTVFGFVVVARFLKEFASILRSFKKDEEIAVHVSEDCFAVLLRDEGDRARTDKRIQELITQLETITLTDGNVIYDYHCTYAGGVCAIAAENRDIALYSRRASSIADNRLKNKGSSWGWYEESDEEKVSMQEALIPEIVRALKNNEFVPFFQPQYKISTGEIVGAELLARWKHPKHGILLPGVFVPLLEASGCVLELDMIMLELACKMVQGWLDKGLYPVPMSVNISRLNLHRRDFMERVRGIVERYGVPKGLIVMETTEAAISENSEKVLALTRQLKADGFILSMDDFGQGNSSLNMMREVPVDIVKLSRNFLLKFQTGERAQTILHHLVEMVHELNAEVVAEGVETPEQEVVVREAGCTIAQGFYYSRPMAAEEFERTMFSQDE